MRKRILTFLLCVVVSGSAFWTSIITLFNWDDLWSGGNYYDSSSIMEPMSSYNYQLEEALRLHYYGIWRGGLSYSETERYEKLTAALKPDVTHFRYQVHDESGQLIMDNLDGQMLAQISKRIQERRFTLLEGDDYRNDDYWLEERQAMMVSTKAGFVAARPADTPLGEFNAYGYRYLDDSYDYNQTYDQRVQQVSLVAEFGASAEINSDIQDAFWSDLTDYHYVQQWLPLTAIVTALLLTAAVWLCIRLCRNAGRDPETGELTLTLHDRIPLELYLAGDVFLITLFIGASDSAAYNLNQYANLASFVGVSLFSGLTAAVCLLFLHTTAVRVKSHTFWSNSICGRSWRGVAGAFSRLGHRLQDAFSNWPMVSRAVVLFCLYFLGTLLTTPTIILIPFYQGFVLWHICNYVKQWKAIQLGTARMLGGEPDFRLNTRKMYPDLRAHAERLNDLGSGMSQAVQEQIKGERFKAELITNVSHDLKTPLTSIINYVDLLKKTGIQDQTALEYIEVLDRKSQRLKKLTEDLVEASKASTGNLTVMKERLGFTQLLNQALGEYEEKLLQSGLEIVTTTPDHELYVEADGRHLWRVIDNLLGNCAKYAMPGTRVYVDVRSWDGSVCLSVKNISKNALNIPSDQLMERFVRGEESRTTEGSGLGLSIAQSLTELQGGTFRIDIDGDLFKAVVVFPEYREPVPLTESAGT